MQSRISDNNSPNLQPAKGPDSGNTLLPMLIGGLVLIVLGAIVVMSFV